MKVIHFAILAALAAIPAFSETSGAPPILLMPHPGMSLQQSILLSEARGNHGFKQSGDNGAYFIRNNNLVWEGEGGTRILCQDFGVQRILDNNWEALP